MPTRMIKDTIRTSPSLAKLSHGAERLWWRIVVSADDFGLFESDTAILKGLAFPLIANVTPKHIAGWLTELEKAELILRYERGERLYGCILSAEVYFRKRSKASKFPLPDADGCVLLPADARGCQLVPRPRPGQCTETGTGADARETPRARSAADAGQVSLRSGKASEAVELLSAVSNTSADPDNAGSLACLVEHEMGGDWERLLTLLRWLASSHPDALFWRPHVSGVPYLRSPDKPKSGRKNWQRVEAVMLAKRPQRGVSTGGDLVDPVDGDDW